MRATKRAITARVVLLIGVVALGGCVAMRTHSDYDPQIEFDAWQSFAWAGEPYSMQYEDGEPGYISPLNLERIERAIESELTAKGYRQLPDPDGADFVVSFTVGTRDRANVETYPIVYRGRWERHWPYYPGSASVHYYTEGMLAIDIFDKASSRPAWHGVARKRITGSDIEDTAGLIQEAVAAILNEYPPQ